MQSKCDIFDDCNFVQLLPTWPMQPPCIVLFREPCAKPLTYNPDTTCACLYGAAIAVTLCVQAAPTSQGTGLELWFISHASILAQGARNGA